MGSKKQPKAPPPTAQEKAFARRSELTLDKEIEEENRRKRQLLRSNLGTDTLLSGLSSGGGIANFSGSSFSPKSSGAGAGSALSPSFNPSAQIFKGDFGAAGGRSLLV